MRVKAIQEVGESFAKALEQGAYVLDYDIAYTSIDNWSKHFTFQSERPADILDSSLSNKATSRLWGGSTNSVKSSLLSMVQYDTDTSMMALFDLLNDGKDLSLRLGRFEEYMEDVHKRMSQNNKRVEPNRQDRRAAFLYLTHAYPDLYCLYDYDGFRAMMIQCGASDIPTPYETDRYAKICRTISTLLLKEEQLVTQYKSANPCNANIHLVLMNDVMKYCLERS